MEKILRIVASIIGVPVESLDEGDSLTTVDAWDSLKHINLVLALEEEFGITFTDSELEETISIAGIPAILGRRGILISGDGAQDGI
jgi:acyl carrier protein